MLHWISANLSTILITSQESPSSLAANSMQPFDL